MISAMPLAGAPCVCLAHIRRKHLSVCALAKLCAEVGGI